MLQQEQTERVKAETDLARIRQKEEQLTQTLRHMEGEFREAIKRIDELTREFEKKEGKLLEMQIKYNKIKGEKHHAEKQADRSKRELKKMTMCLSQTRAKEQ